ncbi:hypothetical protein OHA72_36810 [Dactylosporangium sp. NBC_01737]|uniref:MmyB family transcriptional regulator n=1 Tax=Dactylosporangium sp. NBC_01737 TaxID=2975959 RepID=UPI002E122757|nr:hypothetical protein OHA72_36810 [Dactylosporangium sp. NBC_01737]
MPNTKPSSARLDPSSCRAGDDEQSEHGRGGAGDHRPGDRGDAADPGHVGGLTLAYESMDLRADPDLTMTLYTAEPGSPTEDALHLLASWAATQAPATPARQPSGG